MIRHRALPFCGMFQSERVAQAVEHVTFNHGVAGSSPAALTNEINSLPATPANLNDRWVTLRVTDAVVFPNKWQWLLRPSWRKLRRRWIYLLTGKRSRLLPLGRPPTKKAQQRGVCRALSHKVRQ
jgi:hypothetical protein